MRVDHGADHRLLDIGRTEGGIPVTFQGLPEPDPDLLLDVVGVQRPPAADFDVLAEPGAELVE